MYLKLSLNFNQLQHFIAIADRGSLRAAADHLGLTQPAVSKSLRALEQALGVPLIQRNPRGSTLTAAGKLLYARACLVKNEIDRSVAEIQQMAGANGGTVSFGASAIPSILLIPKAVAAFRTAYRDVGLSLLGGMPSVLLPRLLDGSLDFIVGPMPVEKLSSQIEAIPILRTPAAIAVRRGHPLAKAKYVNDFKDADWVLSANAAHLESTLHEIIARARSSPAKIALRVESLLALYAVLMQTDYVGVVPRCLEGSGVFPKSIIYLDIKDMRVVESYAIFTRSKAPLSAAAAKLVAEVRKQAAI